MKKLAGIFIALIATVVGVSAVFAQSANTITGVTSVSTNSLTTVTVNLSLVNNGTVFLRYRAGSSGNYTSVPSQTVLSTDTSVDFLLERLPLAQSYQIQTSLSSLFSNAVLYSFETPASQFPASDFRHQFDFNETERISLGFGSFRTIPQHVRNIAWDGSQLSIIMGITKHNYGTLDSLTSRGITSIGDDHALVEATILGYGNGVYVAITRQNDTSRVRQVRVYDSPLLFTSSVSNGNLPSNSNHLDVTYDPVGDRWLFLNASTGTSPTRTQDIYALSDLTAPGTATVVGTFTGNQQIQSMVWTTEGLTAAVSVRNAANTAFEIQIVTIPDVTSPNDYISHGTVTQQAVCGSPASGAILEWTGSELIAILTKSCTVGTNTNNRSAMYINLPATIVSSLTAENLELDPRLDVTVQSADESGTTVYVRARPAGTGYLG